MEEPEQQKVAGEVRERLTRVAKTRNAGQVLAGNGAPE